ncbi:helix-turn-helix domain-containing protein [Sinomicrobium sp. M5D2P17]
MKTEQLFRSELKTLGLLSLDKEITSNINDEIYKEYIKVLFLTSGYELQVDLTAYSIKQPTLFFVSPNQHLHFTQTGVEGGYLIFYNRDFYCIQIHDDEVACDGLLFNNIHNMPIVRLDEDETPFFNNIFGQIVNEFALQDASIEEMIRTYLKQLFIKSARLWKRQNLNNALVENQNDLEFFRKFTMLVEEHYKQKHNVADYAELMHVAPKTITHKFKRLKLPLPNDVIKNRIVLEAKRLLVYTNLTSKEIGYILGYEDPAYFSRLFLQKAGETPSGFRTKFLSKD